MIRLLAIVAAFVPAILWLWLFYSRDRYEREPKRLIGKLFLWGLLAGPWAGGLNVLLDGIFNPIADGYGRAGMITIASTILFIGVLVAALNEETMKYLVTTNSVRSDPNFNELVDGMIYMTAAALGFAAGENFIYIVGSYYGVLDAAAKAGMPTSQASFEAFKQAFLVLGPLRSLLSATGHVWFSGITGFFLARRILGGGSGNVVTLGLFLAGLLHSVYNFPLALGEKLGKGGLFSSYFMMTVGVWVIGLLVYLVMFRLSLARSPFRAAQITGGPAPAAATPGGPTPPGT